MVVPPLLLDTQRVDREGTVHPIFNATSANPVLGVCSGRLNLPLWRTAPSVGDVDEGTIPERSSRTSSRCCRYFQGAVKVKVEHEGEYDILAAQAESLKGIDVVKDRNGQSKNTTLTITRSIKTPERFGISAQARRIPARFYYDVH